MRIKILSQVYEVIEVPVIAQGEAMAGQIDHFKSEILICSQLTEEHKKIVLLHEITHAILMQLGLTEEHDNENLVCSISNSFYQVLQDNKELFTTFL